MNDPVSDIARCLSGLRARPLEAGGRLLRLLSVQLPATALISGGLANLPLCLLAYPLRSAEVRPWSKLMGGFALQAALISGFFGIAAFVALRYKSRRPEPDRTPVTGFPDAHTRSSPEEEADLPAVLVAAALIAAAVWVVSRFDPVLQHAKTSVQLLGEWGVWKDLSRGGMFAGIGLLPGFAMLAVPLMEAAAALTLIGGLASSSLLYGSRSSWFPGTWVAAIVVQAGFLLDAHITHQFLHDARRLFEVWLDGRQPQITSALSAWFVQHDAAVMPMLQAQKWALGACVASLAILFRAGVLHGGRETPPEHIFTPSGSTNAATESRL